jgi:hypothetical protein
MISLLYWIHQFGVKISLCGTNCFTWIQQMFYPTGAHKDYIPIFRACGRFSLILIPITNVDTGPGVSKKTQWKFNRMSCIINLAKQFNFYIERKS